MKKRWIVSYQKENQTLEKVVEVENMSEAITHLRFEKNAHSASFTSAKNPELARNITISKKMAMAAFLSGGEYKLPEGCKFGVEWI
jgi:hypothetical protein